VPEIFFEFIVYVFDQHFTHCYAPTFSCLVSNFFYIPERFESLPSPFENIFFEGFFYANLNCKIQSIRFLIVCVKFFKEERLLEFWQQFKEKAFHNFVKLLLPENPEFYFINSVFVSYAVQRNVFFIFDFLESGLIQALIEQWDILNFKIKREVANSIISLLKYSTQGQKAVIQTQFPNIPLLAFDWISSSNELDFLNDLLESFPEIQFNMSEIDSNISFHPS
jgi:hypothetical protein